MVHVMPLSLSLASVKSRLVLPFWYRLTRVVLDKAVKRLSVCVRVIIIIIKHSDIAQMQVRIGHKCAMLAEMAVRLRNSVSMSHRCASVTQPFILCHYCWVVR